MSLPDDKEFDLAVEKAIDEIFGSTKTEEVNVIEDDSLKTPLELEPIEKDDSKVIEFPSLDELLEPELSSSSQEDRGLSQKDLEKLAAVLLSLEWELTIENCLDFLTALEEAKEKSPPELHEIFDLMHQVGSWLKDRAHEARPEWLHFLHQGIVALNLITIHGKEPGPYIEHLRKVLTKLKTHPSAAATEEEKLLRRLIRQLTLDYQRLVLFDWLFNKSPRLKNWQNITRKGINEIETLVEDLPPELRPELKDLAQEVLRKLKAQKTALRQGVKKLAPPFHEAYICEQNLQKYLVPTEEIAFIGPIRENWQDLLLTGYFPLKALLGSWGFLPFVRLKNKLSGPLAQRDEEELRRLKLPVLKGFTQGETLILLWKEDQGLALAVDDAEPVTIPEEAQYLPQENQGQGAIVIGNQKYPIVGVKRVGRSEPEMGTNP